MFHAGSCLCSGLSLALMAQSGSMHLSTHSIARCGNDVIRLDTSGAHPIDMLHISKVISTHPHRVFLHLGQVGARPIQPSLTAHEAQSWLSICKSTIVQSLPGVLCIVPFVLFCGRQV